MWKTKNQKKNKKYASYFRGDHGAFVGQLSTNPDSWRQVEVSLDKILNPETLVPKIQLPVHTNVPIRIIKKNYY